MLGYGLHVRPACGIWALCATCHDSRFGGGSASSAVTIEAVDYFSWAVYRKWELEDPSQLGRLGGNVEISAPADGGDELEPAAE